MASSTSSAEFLLKLPAKQRQLVEHLRDTLIHINSSYEQVCAWKGLAFKVKNNYSCMIAPYKDHLKLMIWRGVDLDDPEERLLGSGENTRHLRIRTKEDIYVGYLHMLLQQQFALYASGVPAQESCETRRGMDMPEHIQKTLEDHKLMDAFSDRPPYQRRDYLYWITSAKRNATQESRLQQMLSELQKGNVYMKMEWGRKTGRRKKS